MDKNFSTRIKDVIKFSREEAQRMGNSFIGPEHLLLGIIREGEGRAIEALEAFNIDLIALKKDLEADMKEEETPMHDTLPLLTSTEKILKMVYLEARGLKNSIVGTGHLLLAILKDKDNMGAKVLNDHQVRYDDIKKYFAGETIQNRADFSDDDDDDSPISGGNEGSRPSSTSSRTASETPVLDNFGVDMTRAAEENRLDPIVGREKEIERLAQILSRRKKNNPVLIGEPGVGKSAIVEGLAIRIIERKVSRVLFDKRVIALDIASIVAGTKYRGQFEERMKAILNEIGKNPDIILFIDEIHTIVGAGGAAGSLDAANMLKPALARGEVQCIGATTLDEYRQNIEKDGALERRFQKIMVDPTTVEETLIILQNIKSRYEDHHNVTYTQEAIEACVKLTERYVSDRHLPDKAIDALDESGSRVHITNIIVPKNIVDLEGSIEKIKDDKLKAVKSQNFELAASYRDKEKEYIIQLEKAKEHWEEEILKHREIVDEEKVAEVVAMISGVPVQRIAQTEGLRLLNMADDLKGKVIGQEDPVLKIVKAIRRNRVGLKDPNRPIGSFIFLGPTGVGKTYLAKVLAEFLFDSQDALIRVDMSEYMEKFSVSRLVGAPPGYVGYEEGGQLTEKVRRKPYAVILLDEIEKAHPDVFNLLLQVLDEGRLTDSLGRQVNFKNTIIIMTSNIGTRQLKDFGRGVGFAASSSSAEGDKEHSRSVIQKALNRAFAPEFLNRIDDVISFDQLDKESIFKIIDLELKGFYERVENLGYKLEISREAKDFIATKGYDIQFGARPLKRAIQKYLEDEMAEIIIRATVSEGDTIIVDFDKEASKITTEIVKAEAKTLIAASDGKTEESKSLSDSTEAEAAE